MKTSQMVTKMLNESKAVKNSAGGIKQFRQIIDFVLSNQRYQDDDLMNEVERTPRQIAALVEKEFDPETIEKAKSVYEKTL